MPIYTGTDQASAFYVGSQAVSRIYRGTTLVWEPDGGGPGPSPKTILLVMANTSSPSDGDENIIDHLEAMGHEVVRRLDSDPEITTGYDAVIVSDSSSNANVGTKYGTVAKPGLCTEGLTSGWRLGSGSTMSGTTTQWNVLNVSPYNGGLTGVRTIYGSEYQQQGMTRSSVEGTDGIIVATEANDSNLVTYAVYEAGAALTSGTAPARRVFMRFGNSVAGTLTADAWTLFDAALNWMLA